ncbi:hypothetical protein CN103_29345, partial [Sinorhizobium meliloti]
AHRNQSHPQSPRSSKPGESDILTLQKQDTLTLRYRRSHNVSPGTGAHPSSFTVPLSSANCLGRRLHGA